VSDFADYLNAHLNSGEISYDTQGCDKLRLALREDFKGNAMVEPYIEDMITWMKANI
jgi:hypothetical protein